MCLWFLCEIVARAECFFFVPYKLRADALPLFLGSVVDKLTEFLSEPAGVGVREGGIFMEVRKNLVFIVSHFQLSNRSLRMLLTKVQFRSKRMSILDVINRAMYAFSKVSGFAHHLVPT